MVRVRDLKNQTGVKGPHPALYCPVDGEVYSANAGDYWDWKADHVFKCSQGHDMILAIQRTVWEQVS